jgi:hypothetical protein
MGQEDVHLAIRKWKFEWIGHTLRKDDGEIPKVIFQLVVYQGIFFSRGVQQIQLRAEGRKNRDLGVVVS